MRRDGLLLAHLAVLAETAQAERPTAAERLEAELGAERAAALVAALVPRPPRR
ncbi:MAG: hypothetical protein ICV71_04390 [Thermoleophilia bacterium]|nr:hypothetical protein [Thermoleophilia bacterium]